MNEHDLAMYRGFIAERDKEIALLRRAIVYYGDRSRMATVEPMELQQAIDRAFEETSADRDWPEDSVHENGNYQCICAECGKPFIGHKRRIRCHACFDAAARAA